MAQQAKPLFLPSYTELATVVSDGLKKTFSNVTVMPCSSSPDLTKSPWHLASNGICGRPTLVEVGSPKYLTPLVNREKNYSFDKIAESIGMADSFIMGACAGSWNHVGVNSELMPNTHIGKNRNTHVCKVDENDPSKYILEKYESDDFSLLANLLACDGNQNGDVLHVKVSCRTGPKNFVTAIRQTLTDYYKDNVVGMAGVFVIRKGKVKAHVMPDFSTTPLNNDDDVNKWLNFYNMTSPLTCLSVLVSGDMGLELRQEHTHFFSEHGQGGHYHYDLDECKEDVEYEGYFVMGEKMIRIDRPQ